MSPLVTMLREQTRAAILAKRDDATALFDATIAALLASAQPAPTETPRTFATKPELMKLLAIRSARTVESMVKSGRIPADAIVRTGRLVRFDVARVLEALRTTPTISRGADWARRRPALRAVEGGR